MQALRRVDALGGLDLEVPADTGGELGRRIRESAELARDYRGYVWSQWFGQRLIQGWTLFAVLLGTGGLVSQAARGGALFTLSLPVSRRRLVAVRAAVGLVELLVLAVLPSLLICNGSDGESRCEQGTSRGAHASRSLVAILATTARWLRAFSAASGRRRRGR